MTTTPQIAVKPGCFSNVLEMVGNTPMIELSQLDTGPCRLFAKCEFMNPAGSIKDRIAMSMISAAEADGRLDPNGDPKPTIIEATAGNTGLGLALVAGQRGYKLKVVVPDKMSQEKIQHLAAMGAEVVLARSDVTKGHPEYYQDVAARIASQTPNSLYINQFSNPDNIRAHYETTAPEIWTQLDGKVDAIVVGVGSGGTLSGMGKFFREQNPGVKIVLADPAESILNPLVNEGKKVEAGSWLIEGMGEDFVPDICEIDLCDEAVAVTDAEAFMGARELLAKEGLLCGSSTGCLVWAACEWCRKQTEPMNVVTLLCDSGAKYLSKMFNDFWMIDNGFIERDRTNDLRDLIARRHASGEDYTIGPDEPIQQAIKRLQMYSISQMVVMEKGKVVGIIDESDILLAVTRDRTNFDKPVSEFMTRRLETVAATSKVEDLMPIFRADRVAIVVDESGGYEGLITRIDMINYLKRQLV
ncbi:CBS [Symbiodinium necroappetens]|uniref:cystathionine beta-synthase n=1 Tax=Symbiodinium necroappetens TaxID=1628268 RepID=A0A812RF06_9DINO|nr:CBS [Symbiodinium necroappetens]